MDVFVIYDGIVVRVGGFVGGIQVLIVEEVLVVGDDEGYYYVVVFFEVFDVRVGFDYYVYEFMVEDIVGFGGGNFVVIQVQVGVVDGCSGDFQDDVVGFLNDGIGNGFDLYVMGGMVEQCVYGFFLMSWLWVVWDVLGN